MKINHPDRAKLYIGIDMDDSRALVSFLREGEKEPVSISLQKPEETYRFPTSLYIGKGGHYLYGAEAEKKRTSPGGEFYENLYLRARDLADTDGLKEAVERLAIYIRRLIKLKENLYQKELFEQHLVIAVPQIDRASVKVLKALKEELGEEVDWMCWMDYGESFYYYTFHQEPSIWKHDVAMFDFSDEKVRFTLLARESRTIPQIVLSGTKDWKTPAWGADCGHEKDAFFARVLKEAFAKRIISGVYLLGDGFDGEWLSETLKVLGPNRRIFIGKNLYTKGAAFAAWKMDQKENWPYLYDCAYKLQTNVSLKVSANGSDTFLTLAAAGENWYTQEKRFDMILTGSTDVDLWMQRRGERSAKIVTLSLDDVWKRAEKTRKIRLETELINEKTMKVTITDLGFGAFFAPTDMVWNFDVNVE